MRIAAQKLAVLTEKLIAHEVQWCGHVAAAVHVGVKTTSVIDQKSIEPIFLADQPEFLYRSGCNVVHSSDHPPARAAFRSHPGAIAAQPPALKRQTDQVKCQKDQRQVNRDSHRARKPYSDSLSRVFRMRFTSFALCRPEMPITFISSLVISAV